MPQQLVLADDLSGACEAAAPFLLRTTRISVHFAQTRLELPVEPERVLAVDLDLRRADPGDAASTLAAVLAAHPGTPAVVKVDSALRGHVDALVTGAATLRGALVVVCTASPAIGRTVRGGVVHVGGVPLHDTDLWRAEPTAAPPSVAAALPSHATASVDLATVRGPREKLVTVLGDAAAAGSVPVVDAETDADLDAVVAAAGAVSTTRVLLVGAGGLAAAVARAFPADEQLAPDPVRPADRVLVVVGSAAPLVHTEVDALRTVHDAAVTDLSPTTLLAGTAGTILAGTAGAMTTGTPSASPAAHRTHVVRLDPAASVDPANGAALTAALADAVMPLVTAGNGPALVLTGGETARAVLDRLGVTRLRPVRHDRGAVTALTDDGRTVVTRPGSFGTGATLAELVTSLLPDRTATTKEPA